MRRFAIIVVAVGDRRAREHLGRLGAQGRPRALLARSSRADADVDLVAVLRLGHRVERMCIVFAIVTKGSATSKLFHTGVRVRVALITLSKIALLVRRPGVHHFVVGSSLSIRARASFPNASSHGALADGLRLAEVVSGGSSPTGLLNRSLHLSKTTFREVLQRLDSVEEFALAEARVRVEVHAADDCNEEGVTSVNAAFDEETLQVARIDEAKVAVINVLVA